MAMGIASKCKAPFLFLMTLILLLAFLPSATASGPKAGATCPKVGTVKVFKNKKFTCLKKGKNLTWSKGVAISREKETPIVAVTPSASPSPQNSGQDSGVIPEFQDVSVRSTGATSARFEFKATGYLSYRVSVVLVSDPNGKEVSSTGIKNESSATIVVDVGDLECGRSNYYEIRATVFSSLDGKGNSRVAGSRIASTGACATPRPSPTPTFTDVYREPSRNSKDLELCKIQEASGIRKRVSESGQAGYKVEAISGFPKTESRISSRGTLRFIAIPIDWSDLPGESNFANHWNEQFGIFTEWANVVSEGKLKVEISLHSNWIRIPGSSSSYAVPFSEASPQSGNFWKNVLPTVDPIIDFTNYQYVIFVLPAGQKIVMESIQELYPGGAIRDYPTKEGKILAFMGAGMYFENWNVKQWSYLAHEIGHLIDFAHGGPARDSGTMGGYDIMFSQDGPSRTLSGWWRFLSGWLEPSQVFCDSADDFQDLSISLTPIDSAARGIKVAVLRTSPTKALIVESRRYSKFDNEKRQALFQKELVKEDWDGVLVYEYDATLGHLQNFLIPVASNTALSAYNWDGRIRYITKESEVVEHAGLKITLTKSGNFDSLTIASLTPAEQAKPRPTPSPAPSPDVIDFDTEPFVFGGAQRTGETTAISTWYGRFFRSYRIQVVNNANQNSAPLFDSGIVNGYQSPFSVQISNLVCNRELTEIAVFYSGLDGKGKSTRIDQSAALSAVNFTPDGKCEGYWTNGGLRGN